MTVQEYCLRYFGMTAEDYNDLIMGMRLATDADYLSWMYTETLTPEMTERLAPMPTAKQIFCRARHGWRCMMHEADREIYSY
jgi:hypothetical protein